MDYLYNSALPIGWSEIYDGAEVLSQIDWETWNVIGKDAVIGPSSKVLELASGKGAFALHLARNFGSNIEGFDVNPESAEYSRNRAKALGLASKAIFAQSDVNGLRVQHDAYDLGVCLGICLGALYIFQGIRMGSLNAVGQAWRILRHFRHVLQKGLCPPSRDYGRVLRGGLSTFHAGGREAVVHW